MGAGAHHSGNARWRYLALVLGGAIGISGSALAEGGPRAGEEKAATCAGCHGVHGVSATPIYPNLAGQHAEYLELALQAYRGRERRGANAALMYPMAEGLSDQDIRDLAAYYSSLDPVSQEEETAR